MEKRTFNERRWKFTSCQNQTNKEELISYHAFAMLWQVNPMVKEMDIHTFKETWGKGLSLLLVPEQREDKSNKSCLGLVVVLSNYLSWNFQKLPKVIWPLAIPHWLRYLLPPTGDANTCEYHSGLVRAILLSQGFSLLPLRYLCTAPLCKAKVAIRRFESV